MRRPSALVPVAVLLASALVGACSGEESSDADGPAPLETALADAVATQLEIDDSLNNLRALVVVHDGETVFEKYWSTTPTTYWDTESVTKSVMSALVGIALADGDLDSVDQTLAELLPEYAEAMRPAVAGTTLEQVLTMTGGFPGDPADPEAQFIFADDPTAAVLASADRPPGQEFRYSNGGSHLTAAILEKATGMSVLQYARSRLFEPLGIDSEPAFEPLMRRSEIDEYEAAAFAWPVDPQGRHAGFGLLKLLPRDLARIGQLYLDEGKWENEQLLPADWVAASTTTQVEVNDQASGYGYLWWIKDDGDAPAYLAWGFGGQAIRVIPDRGLVVALASEVDIADPSDQGSSRDAVSLLTDQVIAPLLE